jgi:hypothetical protein
MHDLVLHLEAHGAEQVEGVAAERARFVHLAHSRHQPLRSLARHRTRLVAHAPAHGRSRAARKRVSRRIV